MGFTIIFLLIFYAGTVIFTKKANLTFVSYYASIFAHKGKIIKLCEDQDLQMKVFSNKLSFYAKFTPYIPVVNLIISLFNPFIIGILFKKFFASGSSNIAHLTAEEMKALENVETEFENDSLVYNLVKKYSYSKFDKCALNRENELMPLAYTLDEVRNIAEKMDKECVVGKIGGLVVALIGFSKEDLNNLTYLESTECFKICDEDELLNCHFKVFINGISLEDANDVSDFIRLCRKTPDTCESKEIDYITSKQRELKKIL